jgi:hypothetical protein
VFVYIYGWYMDRSQKTENLLKKIIIFRAGYLKKPILIYFMSEI